MKTDELFEKLKNFSKLIILRKNEKVNDGVNFFKKEKVTIPEITEFSYKNGGINFQVVQKIEEKKILYIPAYLQFYQHDITPIINNELNFIKEQFEIDENTFNRIIDQFVHSILEFKEYKKNNEIQINNKIIRLIKDLKLESIEVHLQIWVHGLILEEEQFEIDEEIIIRRIRPSDITLLKNEQGAFPRYISEFGMSTPTTLMEIKSEIEISSLKAKIKEYEEKDASYIQLPFYNKLSMVAEIKLQYLFKKILILLRLFQLGSIFYQKFETSYNSFIIGYKSQNISNQRINLNIKYSLSKRNIEFFKKLYYSFRKFNLSQLIAEDDDKPNHLQIALQRYNTAFISGMFSEKIITFAISSLEALFFKPNERLELKFKLCMRVAKIFKFFSFDSLKIFSFVSEAYKIRSEYAHGSIPKSKNVNYKRILNISRISLLIFLQLDIIFRDSEALRTLNKNLNKSLFNPEKKNTTLIKIRKEILVDLIDKAMINEKSSQQLKELLRNNCKFIF